MPVIKFPGITKNKIYAEGVLEAVKESGHENVIVIGWSGPETPSLYVNTPEGEAIITALERVKFELLNTMKNTSDELED